MRSLLPGALAAVTLLSACLGACAQAPGTPNPPRTLPATWAGPRMVAPQARLPVRLESVEVRTEVVGHAAATRVELVFHNPNERVLEGELQFPLADGQLVTGFELDIDGQLRPAVPVEKAKGQQVFEDVIRARVDPALLEVTQGHNHKLRVYPLPPRGTRRVVLHIAQTVGAASRLELPLQFAERLPRLDWQVRVAQTEVNKLRIDAPGVDPRDFVREQLADGWAQVSLRRTDFVAATGKTLSLGLPENPKSLSAQQVLKGRNHFYAELPMPAQEAARTPPRRVALLWDASGSGAQRDHGREFALLDAYFGSLRNVEVTLRVGRDVAEPERRFTVKDGRWDDLRNTLEGLAYDGATHLPALLAPHGAEVALLFSDGLSNWGGNDELPSSSTPTPLYAVTAQPGLDAPGLRRLAEQSGGEWLDLTARSTPQALHSLKTRKTRLVAVSALGAREVVAASVHPVDGRLTFAGLLDGNEPRAELTLTLEQPDGSTTRHTVSVAPSGSSQQVAQRWAAMRVAELESGPPDLHRAEIRRLGKRYGLVTRETSLIVLDAITDYVRYEIEPPASMQAQYEQLLAQQAQRMEKTREDHLARVVDRFKARQAWWSKEFPKNAPPPPQEPKAGSASGREVMSLMQHSSSRDEPERAAPVMSAAAPIAPLAAPAPAMNVERRKSDTDGASTNPPAAATIRLTPWSPDTPYARRLREASPEQVYRVYLDERPDFTGSTAFFLDSADVLYSKGQPELALRVLSNLAEMDLENRHILRVLGYRLLQAQQPKLAIPLFRKVLRLSPNEPQSHRDLGLAHAEAGQWQAAADALWQVVSRPWDTRFPDIDMTALAELNAVIERASRQGPKVDTAAYDERLLQNLPLDMRITLAWDSDNTDIDLWVTDPDGDTVYYGRSLSRQGGQISRDVTGGYGPEEFSLHKAKPGRYTVMANFFGHRQQLVSPSTTLMMRLTTHFGRPGQKDQLVTLRLAGKAEKVTVGTFEIGGP